MGKARKGAAKNPAGLSQREGAPLPCAGLFQQALLGWYRANQRKLPWRTAPSLYKTVVSEFMLQQTQVATVLPYFERWLRAFPGFVELAAAPESLVLKHWEGLGYYSRARSLHRLAKLLSERAEPPRDVAGWRELPGVGPYTAAAICSIALGIPAAVVDGNVVRILTRLTGDRRTFRDGATAAKALASLADTLLNAEDPGSHNQAMMELGATVCLRRGPMCTVCPVVEFCRAGRAGDAEAFPKLEAKRVVEVRFTRLWVRREDGALLLHRRPAGARRLAGLLELPESSGLVANPECLPILAEKTRTIAKQRIKETIRKAAPADVPPQALSNLELEWVSPDALPTVTLSGPHRRWVEELLAKVLP